MFEGSGGGEEELTEDGRHLLRKEEEGRRGGVVMGLWGLHVHDYTWTDELTGLHSKMFDGEECRTRRPFGRWIGGGSGDAYILDGCGVLHWPRWVTPAWCLSALQRHHDSH